MYRRDKIFYNTTISQGHATKKKSYTTLSLILPGTTIVAKPDFTQGQQV